VKQRRSPPPLSSLALALVLVCTGARAVDIGHARLLSAAGQPLRLVVPVTDLTAQEAATFSVRVADAARWREHGLTPPVALAALRVALELDAEAGANGHAQPRQGRFVISAAQPPQGEVVDLLLEVASASGQRRVQISVIVAQPEVEITLAHRDGLAPAATVAVQRGDVLWRIATLHQYPDTSIYQMLAALYQRNRPAFIRANMNWLRAGVTLVIPDAASVRAIDPLAARRLFLAHQEVFFRYRAARAGTLTTLTGQTVDEPVAAAADLTDTPDATDAGADRLRLSGVAPTAAAEQGDEQVARLRAQRDAAQRVEQLERNVRDLNLALQKQAAPAGGAAAGVVAAGEGGAGNSATYAELPARLADATAASVSAPERASGSAAAVAALPQGVTTRPIAGQPSAVKAASAASSTATAAAGASPAAMRQTPPADVVAATTDPTRVASASESESASASSSAPAPAPAPASTSASTASSPLSAVSPTPQADTQRNAQATPQISSQSPPQTRPPAAAPAPALQQVQRWLPWAGLVAVLLALCAWLVHRRASPPKHRRHADPHLDRLPLPDDDAPSPEHDAAMRERFARQLSAIDLTLDDAPPENPGGAAPSQKN